MGSINKRIERAEKVLQLKKEREIRIKALNESGFSNSEIAQALEVSEGYVRNVLKDLERGKE